MAKPKLTRNRIILAFAIAIITDAIQISMTPAIFTGILAIPGEIADFVIDCVVMVAMTLLLGFHWMFLPSMLVELTPGLDLLPTWTGCVAYVVWRRKKEQPPRQIKTVVDNSLK